MKIDKVKLGSAIKKIRSDLKITQKELAEKTGLTENYLSLLENGKRGIGFDKLNEIAGVFRIPAHLLVVLASDAPKKAEKDAKRLLQLIQKLSRQVIDHRISLGHSV